MYLSENNEVAIDIILEKIEMLNNKKSARIEDKLSARNIFRND
ncbi:hypothetical protein A7H1H_1749 [Aliarcobacter butzleri 7h1h]|nr:hypothetical protein [Aliarcobacter butzleri]AGR78019.1 hypothetical protein A7H1H_1749 [Aliarcobacter butzleri 7h1h]